MEAVREKKPAKKAQPVTTVTAKLDDLTTDELLSNLPPIPSDADGIRDNPKGNAESQEVGREDSGESEVAEEVPAEEEKEPIPSVDEFFSADPETDSNVPVSNEIPANVPQLEESAPILDEAGESVMDVPCIGFDSDRLYPTLDSIHNDSADAPMIEECLSEPLDTSLMDPTAPVLSNGSDYAEMPEKAGEKDIILKTRSALKRAYPELDLEALNVTSSTGLTKYPADQGVLISQKERLEEAFFNLYSEPRYVNHELYRLLTEYYTERTSLTVCETQFEEVTRRIKELEELVWNKGRGQVTSYARCGDDYRLERTHEYDVITFETHQAKQMAVELRRMEEIIKTEYAARNHTAQVLETQVEHYVNERLHPFRAIPKTHSVPAIGDHIWGMEQEEAKEPLRQTITILFCFVRRVFEDRAFEERIRKWLKHSTAVLLRVAALEDHLFILSHVLRCPPGINKWAVDLVQVPPVEVWTSRTLIEDFRPEKVFDYSLLVLNLICNPVSRREEFLVHQKFMADEAPVDSWCILDSEGEGDATGEALFLNWDESDIIELLHQIPFQDMFKYMMLIDDVYDVERATLEQLSKLIDFSNKLVMILHQGLKTFHSRRYRNLNKRISRLIRHCVEYLSDHWGAYREGKPRSIELDQIQMAYDHFLLRAVNSIFYSESLGAWQFMAALPYNNVSDGIMWQLLWLLHNNYNEDVQLVDLPIPEIAKELQSLHRLEERLNRMEEDEVFYLLTTFANMTLSRTKSEAFLHTVAVEVFTISYVHKTLRQNHSKVGRELLSRMVNKHPYTVSYLLDLVHEHIAEVGNMSTYLFSEFDLTEWVPESEDLDILYEFLVESDLSTPQNGLARLILQNMNYDYNEQQGLFLTKYNHQKIALILLEAYKKHYLPFDKTGYAYKQFKYISDYALGTKQSATPDGFIQYLWDLLLRLHLHVFDNPSPSQWRLITDDDPPKGIILSLATEGWLQKLRIDVDNGLPPAQYIALMICSIGHARDDIGREGVLLINDMVRKEQFTAAVEAISRVSMLFITSPEILPCNPKFLQSFEAIIQADNTYATMVKSLVTTTLPGDILGQVARMIILQVRKTESWKLQSKCILMWLHVIMSLPEMSPKRGVRAKCRDSILFLLDVLVQLAYQEAGCIEDVILFFQECLTDVTPSCSSSASVVRSMMSFVLGSGSSWPILVPIPSLKQFPWFAWAGLIAESRVEQNREPWKHVLREMNGNSRLILEQGLKAVSAYIKNVPGPEFLHIFRWAQQCLDTDMDHPACPLLWQQFFHFYLQRPTSGGSIGLRLFNHPNYLPLGKLIKTRLNDLAEHYHKKHCELSRNLADQPLADQTKESGRAIVQMKDTRDLFMKLQQYFRSLYLWLSEPRFQEATANHHGYPDQYSPELLRSVLAGDTVFWREMVHAEIIDEYLEELSRRRSVYKAVAPTKSVKSDEKTVEERILRRVRSYEEVSLPPALPIIKLVISEIAREQLLNNDRLLRDTKAQLKSMMNFARAFNVQSVHLTKLTQMSSSLLKELYKIESRSMPVFAQCSLGSKCKQVARIELNFNGSVLCKTTAKGIQDVKAETKSVLSDLRKPPPPNFINACTFIESCITKLVNTLNTHPDLRDRLTRTGGKLFELLVRFMDKELLDHLPTRLFITRCLDVLGQAVISPDPQQTMPLLELVLRNPHLVSYLSPYFTPAVCEADAYCDLYEKLCHSAGPALYETQSILLSKLDVGQYLRSSKTSASQRLRLITTLETALQSIGRKDDAPAVLQQIQALYIQHFEGVLAFNDFEQLIPVLKILLNGIRSNNLPIATFSAFFRTLGYECITQSVLPPYALAPGPGRVLECIRAISEFFRQFRDQDPTTKRNGLYCMCDHYLRPLGQLHTLMGALFVLNKAQEFSRNCPSPDGIEETVRVIFDLYDPWIGVLHEGSLPLVPWLPGESEKARRMLTSYKTVIELGHAAFGRVNVPVLNSVWQRYFTSYVWKASPTYICTLYYEVVLTLPWEHFLPTLNDLRLMPRALEPKFADHLPFVLELFQRINWHHMLHTIAVNWDHQSKAECYSRFCEILVKTGWERSVVAKKSAHSLIFSLDQVDWSCIRVELVKSLLLDFRLNCDPLCVLLPDVDSQDDALLGFMQQIACVRTQNASYSTLEKQREYYAMTGKLIQKCAEMPDTRNLVKDQECVSRFIPKQMDCIKKSVDSEQPDFNQQSMVLVKELLNVLNDVGSPEWAQVLTDGLVSWITDNRGSELILPCLTVASSLSFVESVPVIMEACIMTHSQNEIGFDSADGNWSTILSCLQFPSTRVEQILIKSFESSSFLTLYAYVLTKLPHCDTLDKELMLLDKLVEWVVGSVPADKEAEPKILLLWEKMLFLTVRQLRCGGDIRIVFRHLLRFVESLSQNGEDKLPGGMLSAFGFGRRSTFSVTFRFCCRVMAASVAQHLTEDGLVAGVSDSSAKPKAHRMAQETMAKVKSMQNNKIYADLQSELATTLPMIPSTSLEQSQELVKHLANCFYPTLAYLKVLFFCRF